MRFALYLFWVVPLAAAAPGWVGSKVCATCHGAIFKRYATTAMALSSGPAGSDRVPDGSFSASGVTYSINHLKQKLVFTFGAERRELAYYVGSGAAARSYLTDVDGSLFEAPVTWYTRTHAWGLSPGYGSYSYPFLTRAIAPQCLDCHASGVQAVAGTQNGFLSPPFLEGGVSCERCHGPGAAHAKSTRSADIVNPVLLPVAQRDSVCSQCHLSGEIRVDHARKSMRDFTAGDKLSDYTTAFVKAGESAGMKVTSHVENLAQSACSRQSGGRLWCGSCHDPHSTPAAAEKAVWFRSKCQTCHAPAQCSRGSDCVSCHMPKSSVTDADHVVYTDHSIPRRPLTRNVRTPGDVPLIPFGRGESSPRDLGLAYAIVALRENNPAYNAKAFDLLRGADAQNPNDPQTLSYLADLYKGRNDDRTAAALYRMLLAIDPTQSSAPMNLGAYLMREGRDAEAIPLFRQALKISPGLVLVRLDLAVALLRTGQKEEARLALEKALQFSPSFAQARELLAKIR